MAFNTIPEIAAEDIRGFEDSGEQGARAVVQVDRCCGYSPTVLHLGNDGGNGEYHVVSYGGNNVRMPYLLISVEPNTTYVRHIQQEVGSMPGPLPPSAKAAMMGAAIVLEWRLQALLELRPPSAEQMTNLAELWDVLLARQAEAFCVPIFIIDGPRVELWSMEYARPSLDNSYQISALHPLQQQNFAQTLHPTTHLVKNELEKKSIDSVTSDADPDPAAEGTVRVLQAQSLHENRADGAEEDEGIEGEEEEEEEEEAEHRSAGGENDGRHQGGDNGEVSTEAHSVSGDAEGADTEVDGEGERLEFSGEYVWENSRYVMHFVDGFDLSADRPESSRSDLLRLALVATNLLNLADHCKHFQPKAQLVQQLSQAPLFSPSPLGPVPVTAKEFKGYPTEGPAQHAYPTLPPSASAMLPFAVTAGGKILSPHAHDISGDEKVEEHGLVDKADELHDMRHMEMHSMDIDGKPEEVSYDKVEEEGKMDV